jgi:hypothetical protein
MYSDLLDVLGAGGSNMGAGGRREPDRHVAVSFKAGKMDMTLKEVSPSFLNFVFICVYFFFIYIYSLY